MGVQLAREERCLLAAALSELLLAPVGLLVQPVFGVLVLDRSALGRCNGSMSTAIPVLSESTPERPLPLVSVDDVGCADRARLSQSLLSCQERSYHWSWPCQFRSHQLEDLFHGST